MAINRQDYQYIRNTIPGQQNKISDGSLGIGENITNLVTDLNQNNVGNSAYVDYYGTQDEYKTWQAYLDASGGRSIRETKTITGDTIDSSEGGMSEITRSQTSQGTDIMNAGSGYMFTFFINVEDVWDETSTFSYSFSDSNCSITTEPIYVESNKSIIAGIISDESTVTLTVKIYKNEGYTVKQLIPISEMVTLEDNEEIMSITVEHEDLISFSVISDNIEIKLHSDSLDFSKDVVITISIVKTSSYDKTIRDGLLTTKVKLESNTSYVLQVVGAIKTQNQEFPKNKIIIGKSSSKKEFEFDQYLFFNTGNLSDVEAKLEIYGIGFSYKIFGIVNGVQTQLRSIISPTESKVFLFKADMPWVVNAKGTIVSLKDIPVYFTEEVSTTPVANDFTKDEITTLFAKTPQIRVKDKQTLQIMLPDATNTSWKHYARWKNTKDSSEELAQYMSKIHLIVCRDFLTTSVRAYTSSGADNVLKSIDTRYGIIRSIQRTCISERDSYSDTSGEISLFQLQVTHPQVNISKNDVSLDFTFTKGERTLDGEVSTKTLKNDKIAYKINSQELKLDILSLLGYNHTYSLEKELFTENTATKDIPYKYTSVCFAWGLVEPSGSITLLSGFSSPVIIDRRAAKLYEKDNTYILESQDCVIQTALLKGYTTTSVIGVVLASEASSSGSISSSGDLGFKPTPGGGGITITPIPG